ncbi:hypothetical protein [Nocardioides campestrisoli]|uniref:hypothetical protein n=1 Tax=Nocardioides campestrisoli TaxID=2736757 RepID=UPI0015E79D71|nr:hypothetical protein [Nocardioides campestrisoli]
MRTRTRRPSTRLALAAVASLAVLSLSACSDDSEAEEATESTSESSPSESVEPTETEEDTEPSEDAAGEAPEASSGDSPDWANPVSTPGEKLTTIEAGDVTVDVYQVSTTKATKSGFFADPETNKPIIAEGDEIVFVNYVITNNGDTIDLGASGVKVDPKYDDWPYMQGMDSITDLDLFAEQEVNETAFAAGSFRDPGVYPFGEGQQISYGDNFRYQAGSPITFTVTVIPVDAEGELLHDERVEAEGAAKIS